MAILIYKRVISINRKFVRILSMGNVRKVMFVYLYMKNNKIRMIIKIKIRVDSK